MCMCVFTESENHDLNENGAEDEVDREVNGYDGLPDDADAKVARNGETSVSAARVAVSNASCQ